MLGGADAMVRADEFPCPVTLQQVGRGVCAGRRDLLQRRRRRNNSYLADGPDGQEGVARSVLALAKLCGAASPSMDQGRSKQSLGKGGKNGRNAEAGMCVKARV